MDTLKGTEKLAALIIKDPNFTDIAQRESLFLILSGLYGILLVVLGSVIPLTESFVEADHPYAFEVFYVYLYVVSVLFLVYVYAYLLRTSNVKSTFLTRTLSTTITWTRNVAKSFGRYNSTSSEGSRKKRRISVSVTSHTGSFYLRLGAVGFGIGSMIQSGLQFGQHLVFDGGLAKCVDVLQAIKPLFRLVFIFSQLYFIFRNSKMCINRHKILGRFGLMHMCASNICVWFRLIVVETLHVIHAEEERKLAVVLLNSTVLPVEHETYGTHHDFNTTSHHKKVEPCGWNSVMNRLVKSSGPYLYPCAIEYSIMCASILYVMWKNVGKRPWRYQSDSSDDDLGEELHAIHNQRMTVDCAGSSRGLFLGILLSVGSIISIIAFYVMTEHTVPTSALILSFVSETSMYLFTTVALFIAAYKMKDLHFRADHKGDLEDTLILISHTGLLCFAVFSFVAAILHPYDNRSTLSIVENVMMVIQSTLQTIFILAGERMSAATPEQVRKKPGREFVTFLLLCNFAMWAMNTFQTQKPEHNPIQVEFYGPNAWAIFTHISVPLGILYRFHSSVCFSNIWKNAWKIKKSL